MSQIRSPTILRTTFFGRKKAASKDSNSRPLTNITSQDIAFLVIRKIVLNVGEIYFDNAVHDAREKYTRKNAK